MKKLLIPMFALALLGAGCLSGSDAPEVSPSGTQPAGGVVEFNDTPLFSDDQNEARQLALEVGLLIVQAAQVGVDATEIDAWNDEARLASEALEDEDYAEANTQLRALKAEIEAAIEAAQ